jgi:hypothetical protein
MYSAREQASCYRLLSPYSVLLDIPIFHSWANCNFRVGICRDPSLNFFRSSGTTIDIDLTLTSQIQP